MRKMMTIGMMLSMIWLNAGCETFPKVNDEEVVPRCVASPSRNRTGCHDYQISRQGVGRVSDSVNKPLSALEGAVCFPGEAWADIQPWIVEVFEWVDDRENRN